MIITWAVTFTSLPNKRKIKNPISFFVLKYNTIWLLFIYSLMLSYSFSPIKAFSSLNLGCDDIWHVWAGLWWIYTHFSVYSNLTQHWLWFTISELPEWLIAAQKHHNITWFYLWCNIHGFFFLSHFKQQQKTQHAAALMEEQIFVEDQSQYIVCNTPLSERGPLFLSALLFMLYFCTCTIPPWCHWKNMDTVLCV